MSYICLWRKYVDYSTSLQCLLQVRKCTLLPFPAAFSGAAGFSLAYFSPLLTVCVLWILLHPVPCRISFVRKGTGSCLFNKTSYILALSVLCKIMVIMYVPGIASFQNLSWNYPSVEVVNSLLNHTTLKFFSFCSTQNCTFFLPFQFFSNFLIFSHSKILQ